MEIIKHYKHELTCYQLFISLIKLQKNSPQWKKNPQNVPVFFFLVVLQKKIIILLKNLS